VWAGSADWMPRNFDSRVEIFFPILNEQIKNRVLQNVLQKQVQVRYQIWI
jgi:polyphosphate kinase